MLHQRSIARCRDPMPDAFRANRQRTPERMRTRGLDGVAHQGQAIVPRISEYVLEPLRRTARFVAAEAERDHSVVATRHRELRHLHPLFGAEMADRIRNPLHLDPRSLRLAPDRLVHLLERLLFPQDHARRQRHLRIGDSLLLELLEQMPRRDRVMLRLQEPSTYPNI